MRRPTTGINHPTRQPRRTTAIPPIQHQHPRPHQRLRQFQLLLHVPMEVQLFIYLKQMIYHYQVILVPHEFLALNMEPQHDLESVHHPAVFISIRYLVTKHKVLNLMYQYGAQDLRKVLLHQEIFMDKQY